MSMHKVTAGHGYAYLTRHVAAGDVGLDAGASLTAYDEQTDNPRGSTVCSARSADVDVDVVKRMWVGASVLSGELWAREIRSARPRWIV